MTKYIAYGENGKNKIFDSQVELKAHFEINQAMVARLIAKGKPIEDPDTLETFYIDILED